MSRIGVIGTGHIAAPMVRFLARKGHEITVTRRSEAVSARLAEEFGATIAEPQAVLDKSEIILLCLRPQHAEPVLDPLAFRADHRIVSAMAGVSRAALHRLCAPTADVVQFIPLGYLETGGCPLAGFGDTALLDALFAPENPVVATSSEEALNAHFAICAMVPGLLDLLSTGANWLEQQTGDAQRAAFFTSQMVAGFLGALDKQDAQHLAKERDALATEGSLSLQMTSTLREHGAHDALETALQAIGQRLNPKGSSS